MLNTGVRAAPLTLDNYAELLELAGIERATAPCSECGPDATPVSTEALWILHDRTESDLATVRLLCSHHALEWTRTGTLAGRP